MSDSPATPTVSVIVPAYNVAPYLERCLRSASAQTLRTIEIIVVDDASTDGTRTVLAAAAAKDARIKPVLLERNGGVCRARNAALDRARGQWIAVLDSDDWMAPARLERMVAAAEALGAQWIADDQYFIREGADEPAARLFADEPPGARLIDARHFIAQDRPDYMGYGLLKPVIKRAFLCAHDIRYRPGTERFEDFLIDIECAAHGASLALLNEAHYYYLLRQGSLTALDPLRTVAGLLKVNDLAEAAAARAGATALVESLQARRALIEASRRYYDVILPVKRREWTGAFCALSRDPAIWPLLARKLVRRLWRAARREDRLDLVLLPGRHARP